MSGQRLGFGYTETLSEDLAKLQLIRRQQLQLFSQQKAEVFKKHNSILQKLLVVKLLRPSITLIDDCQASIERSVLILNNFIFVENLKLECYYS